MTKLDIGMIQNYIRSILAGDTTVEYLDAPNHLSANSGVFRIQTHHYGFTFFRIFDDWTISAYGYTEEDIACLYIDSFIMAVVNGYYTENGRDELESLKNSKEAKKRQPSNTSTIW